VDIESQFLLVFGFSDEVGVNGLVFNLDVVLEFCEVISGLDFVSLEVFNGLFEVLS